VWHSLGGDPKMFKEIEENADRDGYGASALRVRLKRGLHEGRRWSE